MLSNNPQAIGDMDLAAEEKRYLKQKQRRASLENDE